MTNISHSAEKGEGLMLSASRQNIASITLIISLSAPIDLTALHLPHFLNHVTTKPTNSDNLLSRTSYRDSSDNACSRSISSCHERWQGFSAMMMELVWVCVE